MKQLPLIALGAVAMLAACSQKPNNQFTVSGDLPDADGQKIYMTAEVADTMFVDSVSVENGKFLYTGTMPDSVPAVHFYCRLGSPANMNDSTIFEVFAQPGLAITVSGLTAGNFTDAVISGAPVNDEMNAYQESVKPLNDQLYAIIDSIRSSADPEAAIAKYGAPADSLQNLIETMENDYIKQNPAKLYAGVLLSRSYYTMKYDDLKAAYSALSPDAQKMAQGVEKYLTALDNVQPGKPAPELSGLTPDGKEAKLSDCKGKVVLLDFWATWCGPCRASLPHVQEIYNKYHDKGLDVFMVSCDQDEEAWKKFIADGTDGMQNYTQILTYKEVDGKTIDQSKEYGVMFIPNKFLIDAEGNIIGQFNDEKELDAKLAELFPETK